MFNDRLLNGMLVLLCRWMCRLVLVCGLLVVRWLSIVVGLLK